MSEPIHIISLGAGVQSSTMALMAAAGEITPMPSCAIFADTQAEPASVYRWLDWLEKQLPFPVHRVTAGNLTEEAVKVRESKTGTLYVRPGLPVFFNAGEGIGYRHCTMDFKIIPIRKKLQEIRGKSNVVQWIGISLDEVERMKPSRDAWAESIWPLVEKRMSRHDCERWMNKNGFPTPPRSSCSYCPHHSNREWRRLKTEEPEAFASAVAFELSLQSAYSQLGDRGVPFLHRTGVPLDQVDLSTDDERGQGLLWGNECEGMCGV